MCRVCSIPWWPMSPMIGTGVLTAIVAVAGFILSIVMLVDCLRRAQSEFINPLTQDGKHDKLIWAGAIVLSFWFYFIGAIVYFFVVKRARPKSEQ